MLFQFNFFSSLLLIFFVHGLVYCILLFSKSFVANKVPNRWLSLFLLLCILYIFPWMVGFGGWYNKQPYRDILFYMPFIHLFTIGPVIFFYVQSLLNPSFTFTKKQLWHFLPTVLYIIYCLIMVVYDKLILHDYYFLRDGEDRDFDDWYQITGFISMSVYFGLSIRYYHLYKQLSSQVLSYANSVLFSWVRNFLVAFLMFLGTRLLFFILFLFKDYGYVGDWWHFMAFAIIFYYIAINGYANAVVSKLAFKVNMLGNKPALLLNYTIIPDDDIQIEEADFVEVETDSKSAVSITNTDLQIWKDKIYSLLVNNKLYQEPELSLVDVAKQLSTNVSILSKAINQGFEMNFNDFVNYYRVQAVIEMLNQKEHKKQTLLGIAYDAGFNSKATFNRAFKKFTSSSPKEWIEKQGL